MLKHWGTFALLGIVTAGTTIAASDPIAQRRAIMRDNGKIERTANSIILGKFLPEKATAAMQRLEPNMTHFVTLFPPGTETGGETHADPAIWGDRETFEALAAEMIARAKAAEAAIAIGQDAFAIAWDEAKAVCDACHVSFAPLMTN